MHRICVLLVLATAAFAEAGGGSSGGNGGAPAQPGGGGDQPAGQAPGGLGIIWIVFLGILVIMIWSSFRNQKKEQRKRKEMVEALKLGDRVTTIGGLQGEVVRRGEQTVDIRTGEGQDGPVLTFTIGAVNQVEGADDDAKKE